MSESRLNVAIIGGGIGGLAAANALRANGIEVTVYEQAQALAEVGAGVVLHPNSVRLLKRLGMEPAIQRRGAHIDASSQYMRHDGSRVSPYQTADSSGWHAVYGMHRADLLDIFLAPLPEDVIQTGHRCTHVEQDDGGVRLFFDNGASAVADVAIGADGIHSTLQRFVVPPSQPRFSGQAAYRGLVEADLVPEFPRTLSLWMGPQRHFLVYPVRAGKLLNYVAFVPAADGSESWSAPGDPAKLAEEFEGWDPRIGSLIEKVESTFLWGLYDRDPLETWTRGRLTLLGDAAHPMLPHLGQGANQSIEDAFALATVLRNARGDTVPRALGIYEKVRRARTSAVQLGARDNDRRYNSSYEDLERRDAEIASSQQFRSWIFDYDAEAAAQAELLSL